MLAEMLLFIPSVALYRQGWIDDRAEQAALMAQALTGVPNYKASENLTQQFMEDTSVTAMSAKSDDVKTFLLGNPPRADEIGRMIEVDLREANRLPSLLAPLQDVFSDRQDVLRVTLKSPVKEQETLELLIFRHNLRMALLDYLTRIFWWSLGKILNAAGIFKRVPNAKTKSVSFSANLRMLNNRSARPSVNVNGLRDWVWL